MVMECEDRCGELFENDSGLLSEIDWRARIDGIKKKVKPTCPEEIDSCLVNAVGRRANMPVGLLFSGGVDSSLLALLLHQRRASFMGFCVGLKGSPDIVAARQSANLLGVEVVVKEVSINEIKQTIETLHSVLGPCLGPPQNLAVLYGVAAVEWVAISLAREHGFSVIMGGLGSEEIFAGYERHAKALDINKECWRGLEAMWSRDLVRDAAIAKALGVKLQTPFLDVDLIRTAMGVGGSLKIVDGLKKACLRHASVRLGLPKEVAFRPKKAAQYGSGFDRAIEKLSKAAGFGFKHEFLSAMINNQSRDSPYAKPQPLN